MFSFSPTNLKHKISFSTAQSWFACVLVKTIINFAVMRHFILRMEGKSIVKPFFSETKKTN